MSDIRSIIVHVDDAAASAARLQLAHRLARQFDAALTAANAFTPSVIAVPLGFNTDPDAAAMLLALDGERRASAKARFDQAVATGLSGAHWRELSGEPVRALVQAAFYADLLVLGQRAPDDPAPGVPAGFVESVLLDSGVPAIVVPVIGPPATLARKILIAWKPSRESARALTAALPLLRQAEQVHVGVWDDATTRAEEVAPLIEARLRSHGVAATVHRGGPAAGEAGELLLSMAADLESDLLVMGCYGHMRTREFLLGGMTRTILQSMTIPVLMAH